MNEGDAIAPKEGEGFLVDEESKGVEKGAYNVLKWIHLRSHISFP